LAERYRIEHLPKKAKSSQVNDWQMIKNEILPRLGSRKVADVHHGDIEALHRDITANGKPIRANRVLAVASKMFSLALRPAEGEQAPWRDQAQGNPCKGVERNPEEGHERFFSEAELAALSDALVAYGPTPAANCIRFIMLTGCRPGEAMAATWEQFEVEPGFWIKPSAHTKQRKIHKVPLGPAAIELLCRIRADREATPRSSRSNYVFPGQLSGQPLKQLQTTWDEVAGTATVSLWGDSRDLKIAEVVADLEKGLGRRPARAECQAIAGQRGVKLPPGLSDARVYDLRHTFASIGAGGGLSLPIIGRLLGHTQARTTQRYSHLADDPLREAAVRIATQIAGAGKSKPNVVPLSKQGDARMGR
jgi:integrase